MKLFLDTEFTNLSANELASIGLISEDGAHSFYQEVSDLPLENASEFFVQEVLPLMSGNGVPLEQLSRQLVQWLNSLPVHNSNPIVVVADYTGDFSLFQRTISHKSVNPRIKYSLIGACIMELAIAESITPTPDTHLDEASSKKLNLLNLAYLNGQLLYYDKLDARVHHALADANAIRQGWLVAKSSLPNRYSY